MAFRYNVHMEYQDTGNDVSKNPIVNAAGGGLVGVIQGPGVLPVIGVAGGPLDFYCRTGDVLLIGNTHSPVAKSCGGNSLPINCEIGVFTTAAGVMEGVSMNATVTVRVRAKYSIASGQPPAASRRISVRYYHVASGGGETLLDSVSFGNLSTGYTNWSGPVTINQAWGAGEKFRVKYQGILQGF